MLLHQLPDHQEDYSSGAGERDLDPYHYHSDLMIGVNMHQQSLYDQGIDTKVEQLLVHMGQQYIGPNTHGFIPSPKMQQLSCEAWVKIPPEDCVLLSNLQKITNPPGQL